MYTVFDLFCGTGGFSKGFEQTGQFKILAGLDNVSDSIATFRANYPHARAFHKDITKFKAIDAANDLSLERYELDVLIGGPPCQGFSSIRPFRSAEVDDPRNHLFHHFGFYLDYFRPKIFILENVLGLISHKNGKALAEMLAYFSTLGYSVNWGILNAVHYGLPQRRERVFFLGHLSSKKITFPEPSHFYEGRSMMSKSSELIAPLPFMKNLLKPVVTIEDAISDLPCLEAGQEVNTYQNTYNLSEYQKEHRGTCTTLSLHKATAHTPQMLEIIKQAGTNRAALPNGLTKSGFSTSYSRLDCNAPAVTLTVNFVHPASNKCIHPYQDRALTPREGARLQGFKDDFRFCGSRTQIVKQIGNAVPPLMGKVIAERLLEYL